MKLVILLALLTTGCGTMAGAIKAAGNDHAALYVKVPTLYGTPLGCRVNPYAPKPGVTVVIVCNDSGLSITFSAPLQ